jgi:uncharacterized protein YndB with AHSA1/START domain
MPAAPVVRRFSTTAHSAASPERVYAVLADGPGWKDWAGPMIGHASWEATGDPDPGGPGAIRVLGRPPFVSREQIVETDPPRHLAYIVLSGLPVRSYRADVRLVPEGTGTRIEWEGRVEASIPGSGALLAAFLRQTISGFARRLAAAA